MTNKEAIARIKDHITIHSLQEPRAVRISEALNMAIKALEQESCDDAINRAEAQTAIQCAAKRYCTTSNTPREIGVVTTEYLISITDATDALRKLPPVTPKQKIGEWHINSDGYYPYCSECKEEPKNREMTKYCPNCGAKMGSV